MVHLLIVSMLAIFAPQSAAVGPHWTWPLPGSPVVVRGFDPPSAPWGSGHRGVDLAAPPGTVVLAAGGGTVAFAGNVAGQPVVSIDHPGGLRTTYEPVTAIVHSGDSVSLAQPIGVLAAGHPGCVVAGCLHWGLRREQTYLDPLALLRPLHIRLKPLVVG